MKEKKKKNRFKVGLEFTNLKKLRNKKYRTNREFKNK